MGKMDTDSRGRLLTRPQKQSVKNQNLVSGARGPITNEVPTDVDIGGIPPAQGGENIDRQPFSLLASISGSSANCL